MSSDLLHVDEPFYPFITPSVDVGDVADKPGISVSRHDDHNVEIKIHREVNSRRHDESFDLYLFIPKSFDLPFWGKSELQRDFRIRLRMSLTSQTKSSQSEVAQAIVKLHKLTDEYLHHDADPRDLDCRVFELSRDTGSVIVEWIKRKTVEHSKEALVSCGLATPLATREIALSTLAERLQELVQMLAKLRNHTTYVLAQDRGSLFLFDEYLSNAYVQYLASLRNVLDQIKEVRAGESDTLSSHIKKLESLLCSAQEDESNLKRRLNLPDERRLSDEEREKRLVHLSLIKKFFQSKTFMNVTRQPVIKKFSETTAVAGTALAGGVAAVVQRYSQADVGEFSMNTFMVLCFGVFLYVLRDRLKDWAKEKFSDHVKKRVPDFEQKLEIKHLPAGRVKEWFSIEHKKNLPDGVLHLRRLAYTSAFEEELGEEVLHYRRLQELEIKTEQNQSNALHEIIRLNIDRYLKYMDDPIKETFSLDNYGNIFKSASRRVYHFYLCIRSEVKSSTNQDLVYRLVLNKNGLLRVEEIEV